jgi:MSHA biogenesis protein MshP
MTAPRRPLKNPPHLRQSRPKQRGFAVVAALFLLVVLAALGGFMLTISNTAQLTSAQDVQGSRAYWAARGGLEWAIAGVKATAPVSPAVAPPATCPTATAPTMLDGFAMVVTCSVQVYSEADASVRMFRLTSVATSADASVGSVGFVERSVSALLEQ